VEDAGKNAFSGFLGFGDFDVFVAIGEDAESGVSELFIGHADFSGCVIRDGRDGCAGCVAMRR
jgi:predicted nucleic acid-binding Zn finger protein